MKRAIAVQVRADSVLDTVYGYNETRKEFFTCSRQSFSLLPFLDRFRSEEEHIDLVMNSHARMPQRKDVARALDELTSRKLMITESELIERLTAAPERSTYAESELYIPTKDRPQTAAGCVRSHLAGTKTRSVTLVAEGSHNVSPALWSDLKDLPRPEWERVRILGIPDRERSLQRILQTLKPEASLESAIKTCLSQRESPIPQYGVNQNWILLASAGETLVSADDDTMAEIVDRPAVGRRIQLSSGDDPTVLETYLTQADLESDVTFVTHDVMEDHDKTLGAAAEVVNRNLIDIVDTDSADPGIVKRLMGSRGMVRATSLGIAGDPGRAALQFLLFDEGSRRESYVRTSSILDSALVSQAVVRAVSQLTLSAGGHFMTTHVGLDNRDVLPPFLPLGGNQDGLFGRMLLSLIPGSVIAHLPTAVRHKRPEGRTVSIQSVRRILPTLAGFLGLVFDDFNLVQPYESPEYAMRRGGAHLASVAALSQRDFSDLMRLHWNRYLAERADHLHYLLAKYGSSPRHWAKHVRALLSTIDQQLDDSGMPIPVELTYLPEAQSAVSTFQRLISDFGTFLYHWPDIWHAARSMRAEGYRFYSPISGSDSRAL